ncbi:MAG TPA: hypothetical protein VKS78_10055 [Roseiarcus sp.]|nr:hypothetical protein [Roseiarcus sp.]
MFPVIDTTLLLPLSQGGGRVRSIRGRVQNATFAERFKNLTKFADRPAHVKNFWVSKSNNKGESDLIVVYQTEGGQTFALLIEDKVDAPLQPDQAKRYALRANRDRAEGFYSEYEVLLCAPREYIERHRDELGGFHPLIPLEQIAEIIRVQNDPRAEYRALFLESASKRNASAWVREDDPATNAFWDAGYELATREFPQLEMKRQKLTKDSLWFTFKPHDFPKASLKRVVIEFKAHRGQIDLTFGETTAYLFKPLIAHLLDSDMIVVQQVMRQRSGL